MVRADSDRIPATFKVMVPLFGCRDNCEHLRVMFRNLFLQVKASLKKYATAGRLPAIA